MKTNNLIQNLPFDLPLKPACSRTALTPFLTTPPSAGSRLGAIGKTALLLVSIAAFGPPSLLAATGDLDTGFNPDPSSYPSAIAVQPNGKIVVGGAFTSVGGVVRNRAARLKTDGTVDALFNPDANGTVLCATVLSDESVIIGGYFSTVGGVARNGIARLSAGGAVDASFNPNANAEVRAIAALTDGKFIIAGDFTTVGGTARNRIAKLNADGTLDSSFNPDANGTVRTVAVQADGKLVVGGNFTSVGGTTRNRIARINADGTADTSFDPNADDVIQAIALQADGKIILAGDFTSLRPNGAANPTTRNHIARVYADGTLDAFFDPNTSGTVYAVVLQVDGKIVLGGNFLYLTPNGSSSSAMQRDLARVNSDGTLDTSFNTEPNGAVVALSLQADGQLLISGVFTTVNGVAVNYAARIENDSFYGILHVSSANQVEWYRGGTGPEAQDVTFEWSAIGGTSWTTLGTGTRTGAGWELDGLELPARGRIRALARVIGGMRNSSSGLVQQTASYDFGGPPRVVNPVADFTVDEDAADTVINLRMIFEDLETADADLAYSLEGNDNPGLITASVDNTTDLLTLHYQVNRSGPATITVRATDASGLYDQDEFVVIVNRRNDGDPGDADTNFDLNVDGPAVTTAALQADGKVLIGGNFSELSPNGTGISTTRNNIARINADGTLDSGFDPNANGEVSTVAVQTNGKIILGGEFTSLRPNGAISSITRNFIARLNSDGNIDASFNPNPNSDVYSVAVQLDGKIILAGSFTSLRPNGGAASTSRNRVARVNSAGTLDAAFDPNVNNLVWSIAVQPDGKVILGGEFSAIQPNSAATATARNHIARVASDGTLDASFDPSANSTVLTIAVQPDGKIVVGGSFTEIGGIERKYIARLNEDGTLDERFAADANAYVESLVLQSDGKIVLGGGFTEINGTVRKYIARINSDGSVDDTFTVDADGAVESIAMQGDGTAIVVGEFETVNGLTRNCIVRLTNDAATQSLTASENNRVQWLRSGSSPETIAVSFDLSIDNGATWILLGSGTRIAGGWELSGLSLPLGGQLRARGRVTDGDSSGLIQTTAAYVAPVLITNPRRNYDGSFSFSFVSVAGATFKVLVSSDISLPVSEWTELGTTFELAPGHYQFNDATLSPPARRFYRVRWPE